MKSSNPRVTISEHTLPEGTSHLDIFFESDAECLITYEVFLSSDNLYDNKILSCIRKKDHRKIYLDYEGEISNDRGFLKILLKGFYIKKDCLGNQKISIEIKDSNVILYD